MLSITSLVSSDRRGSRSSFRASTSDTAQFRTARQSTPSRRRSSSAVMSLVVILRVHAGLDIVNEEVDAQQPAGPHPLEEQAWIADGRLASERRLDELTHLH